MKCIECNEDLVACTQGSAQTLVGYSSPPGHDHDDNCVKKEYWCKNDHIQVLSKQRRCSNPDCAWVGKDECFCHKGKKVDEWPQVSETRSAWWERRGN